MIFFIDFLKAAAACLITNSHYTGIYPTDLIANGGLIGDVLFFSVSGYCLYHIRHGFLKWYAKRLLRCYVSMLLITVVYLVLGQYSIREHSLSWWLVYPTAYHFVASIVILYVPYYFVMTTPGLRKRLPLLMLAVFLGAVIYYLVGYDRSYYHIDNVRQPMIRILFFESMLLGAWFRQNDKRTGKATIWHILAVIVSVGAYFVSKLIFSRIPRFSDLQILNQLLIFMLLFCLFRVASDGRECLEKLPKCVKRFVRLLSKITLEIYVVQSVLIGLIRPLFGFPLNWLILTASIFLSALVLNRVSIRLTAVIDRLPIWRNYENFDRLTEK